MKIKKLIIHNIASIEDATIDFDGQVLGSQDLFLICGPTGSGKSTILDAISLALFNTAPRMANSVSDDINIYNDGADADQSMPNNIKDVVHLVRKNAVEAFVSLSFEADDQGYTALWRVSRIGQYRGGKETKPFASLTLAEKVKKPIKKEWTLISDQGNEVIGDNAVKAAIKAAIKMDYGQFCKTTLLAQGEFTRFLASKSDTKAEILEKLVGTEKYAEVGAVINKTYNALDSKVRMIAAQLNEAVFLTEEQKAEKIAEMAEIDAKAKTTGERLQTVNGKIKWIDDSEAARKTLDKAKETMDAASAALATDEVMNMEKRLALWDKTVEVRGAITKKQEAVDNEKNNRTTAEKLTQLYTHLAADTVARTGKMRDMERDVAERREALVLDQPYETMFANAKAINSKHKETLANRKTIAENQPAIKELGDKIAANQEKLRKTEDDKDKALADIAKANDDKKLLQEKLKELGEDSVNKEYTAVKDHIALIDKAENALSKYNDDKATHARRTEEAKADHDLIAPRKQICDTVRDAHEKAKTAEEYSRQQYESVVAAISDHAKRLRATLQTGHPCPVCGQIVASLLSDKEVDDMVQPLKKGYEDAKALSAKLRDELLEADVALRSAKQKAESADEEVKKAKENVETSGKDLVQWLDKLGIAPDTDIAGAIVTMRQAAQVKENGIQERQNQIAAVRKEINGIEEKVKKIQDERQASAEKSIKKITAAIQKDSALKATKEGENDAAGKAVERLLQEITAMVDNAWKPQEEGDFYDALANAANNYEKARKDCKDKETGLAELRQQLERMDRIRGDIDSQYPQWREAPLPEAAIDDEAERQWTLLSNKASALSKAIADTMRAAAQAQEKIADFADANQDIAIEAVEALLDTRSADIEADRKTLAKLQQDHATEKGKYQAAVAEADKYRESPLAEDETREALAAAAEDWRKQIDEGNIRKGVLKQQIDDDQKNREAHGAKKAELDALRDELGEWAQLNRYLGNSNGKNFRNVAQSFILSELLDKANTYLANISTRYTLFCYPGTLTIMIRDANQGGAERATNTLSGGESFIISLALALGLSSMQNVNFEVDTLFIDEGFGTLSPEYLDPVITALKRLHQFYGRRVGLISHVETLRQRIPIWIEVVKHGNSGSKITLSHE